MSSLTETSSLKNLFMDLVVEQSESDRDRSKLKGGKGNGWQVADLIKKKANRKSLKKALDECSLHKEKTVQEFQKGIFISPNPSYTTVIASIIDQVKQAEREKVLNLRQSLKKGEAEAEAEDKIVTENAVLDTASVAQVVEIGLIVTLELIQGSHEAHPDICFRALQALLDTLQGQKLESLKKEPLAVMEKLCSVLLQIAMCDYDKIAYGKDPEHHELLQRISALAFSCLISLVLAWGRTGKIFSAIAAILTSSKTGKNFMIEVPDILVKLQETTLGCMLGTSHLPAPPQIGVLKQSNSAKFQWECEWTHRRRAISIACDGSSVYLLLCDGFIAKIGTGYDQTTPGELYATTKAPVSTTSQLPKIYNQGCTRLLYCKGFLYVFHQHSVIAWFDAKTLERMNTPLIISHKSSNGIWFSDGESIGLLQKSNESEFHVHCFAVDDGTISAKSSPLHIDPIRTRIKALGDPSTKAMMELRNTLDTCSSNIVQVMCGKEFHLYLLDNGQVMFTGNQESLGIKKGKSKRGRRHSFLEIPHSPKIDRIAVAPNGNHAILVSSNGEAFFVGTSHRGEDGVVTKIQAAAKPQKVRKMSCMDGKVVVNCACNAGTSAFITSNGQLYMFGKDTARAENKTGWVNALKNIDMKQVSLGKAHVVTVSSDGKLYTFGINNKGQCGRQDSNLSFAERIVEAKLEKDVSMHEEGINIDENNLTGPPVAPICSPTQHKWAREECRICAVCQECTGYGPRCVSSRNHQRVPRLSCGCGAGDSGCTKCGCCRTCAQEADVKAVKEDQGAGHSITINKRANGHGPRRNVALVGHGVATSSEVDVLKEASKTAILPPCRVIVGDDKIKVSQVACGAHHTVLVLENGSLYGFGLNNYGQLGLGDLSIRNQPCLIPVVEAMRSVACGSYHTVMLSLTGRVYVSGKTGCLSSHILGHEQGEEMYSSPQLLDLPQVTWISACHDVTFVKFGETLLDAKRFCHTHVLANEKNLVILKASEDDNAASQSTTSCTSHGKPICSHASPGTVVVDRKSGFCFNFPGSEQFRMNTSTLACVDPVHDVMWSLNTSVWSFESFALHGNGACFNKASGLVQPTLSPFSTQVAIPVKAGAKVLCSQAAVNVLSCFDAILATCPRGGTANLPNLNVPVEADMKHTARLGFSKKLKEVEDFSTVTRFKSNGGGWGYSAHSVEAIRFSCDTDVLLGGCGVYGGRGEYSVVMKVYEDKDMDEDAEAEGQLLLQTCDIPYECGYREKFNVLFEEPILITAGHFYTISAKITGPSSDCGSHGEPQILTEDNVRFMFHRSKLSNNGTDVTAGQIPDLLYALLPSENSTSKVPDEAVHQPEKCVPVQVISEEFFSEVTEDGLKALLSLVNWAWEWLTVKVNSCLLEHGHMCKGCADACVEIDNMSFVCVCSLRLLGAKIMKITKLHGEDSHECATEVSSCSELVFRILTDQIVSSVSWDWDLYEAESKPLSCHGKLSTAVSRILHQCQKLMCSCVDAFFPSPVLKWNRLNYIISLQNDENMSASAVQRLLSVFFDALCQPKIDLIQCLPLFPRTLSNLHSVKSLISSPASAETHTSSTGNGFDPQRIWQNGTEISVGSLQDVAQSVIAIIVDSVHDTMEKQNDQHDLVGFSNVKYPDILRHPKSVLVASACHFMATLMHELCFKAIEGSDALHPSYYTGNIDFLVASRFSQHVSNRCWNTGHGSPDAVCFSVASSDVSVLGFGVYGGGGDHTYELEIMRQISGTGRSDRADRQTTRWETLQHTSGTYKISNCDQRNVAHIMFSNGVQLEENQVYAVRLRNHGERTYCGEQGSSCTRGSDGTEFQFFPCALSSNGTSVIRGQIPCILYTRYLSEDEFAGSPNNDWMGTATTCAKSRATYEKQALCVLGIISDALVNILTGIPVQRSKGEDMLEKSTNAKLSSSGTKDDIPEEQEPMKKEGIEGVLDTPLASDLLPQSFEAIKMLVKRSPYCAVEVLSLSQRLLPPLASFLREVDYIPKGAFSEKKEEKSHILVIESTHPYKSACVTQYVASFPEAVGCMVLEFSPKCQTAQSEDVLELFLPAKNDGKVSNAARDIPVLKKMFQQRNWPRDAVVLPGNSIIFSLTTASDYENGKVKNPKAFYGFSCTVTGFEMCSPDKRASRYKIIRQVTSVAGLSCVTLMRIGGVLRETLPVSLLVPPDIKHVSHQMQTAEAVAKVILSQHPKLFHYGLSTETAVTVSQALSGDLPLNPESTEKKFLTDFIAAATNTSGGRLARWLQPDSYVDPTQCDLSLDHHNLIKDFATVITIVIKDQYGETVSVPSLIIELTAKPIPVKDARANEVCSESTYALSETEHSEYPSLFETVYEPTRHKDSTYHSISMMRTYRKYSFEELRHLFPRKHVLKSESMLVAMVEKGVYMATWIPMHAINYIIAVTFDHELKGPRKHVVVKEPDGMGSQINRSCLHGDRSKTMKFVITNSSGLRIRSSPTLQSSQVGILKCGDIIKTVDQLRNNDGLWVKLAKVSMESFCNQGCQESWCLAFHSHRNKVLLVPSEDTEKCDHAPENNKDQDDCSATTVATKMTNAAVSPFTVKHSQRTQQTVFGSPLPEEAKMNLVPGIFCVVKCGNSGHNVRSGPSMKAAPVGMLNLGDHANAVEVLQNGSDVWIRLGTFDREKYCSGSGFFGESFVAWTLVSAGSLRFLKRTSEAGAFRSDPFCNSVQMSGSDSHSGKKESLPVVKSKAGHTSERAPVERSLQPSSATIRVDEKSLSRGRPKSVVSKQKILIDEKKVRADSSSPSSHMDRFSATANSKKLPASHQLLRKLRRKGRQRASHENLEHTRSFSADQLLLKRLCGVEQSKQKCKQNAAKSFSRKHASDIDSGGIKHRRCNESDGSSADTLDEEGNIKSPSPSENSRGADIGPPDLRAPSLGHGFSSRISSPARAKKENSIHHIRHPARITPDGLSPLVAECSRAVFVALLWHDGMVHDAMTCASYIKFSHSAKPDIGSGDNHKQKPPITLGRRRANTISEAGIEDVRDTMALGRAKCRKRQSSDELATTLTCLSKLWQDVSQAVVDFHVRNQAFSPCVTPIPNLNKDNRGVAYENCNTMPSVPQKCIEVKEHENRKTNIAVQRNVPADEGQPVLGNVGVKCARVAKQPQQKDTKCELCGKYFPYPVTYHMKQAHKGCGMLASGFGYNSSGHYCGGWAGDCGDGGDGASTWYLLCMRCRENYVRSSQDGRSYQVVTTRQKLPDQIHKESPSSHKIMKENAMFLLELFGGAYSNAGLTRASHLTLGGYRKAFPNPNMTPSPGTTFADTFHDTEVLSEEESSGNGVSFHRTVEGQHHSERADSHHGLDDMKAWQKMFQDVRRSYSRSVSASETPSSRAARYQDYPSGLSSILRFVRQQHDLKSLRSYLCLSMRRAVLRVYALQALSWLLSSMVDEEGIHDVLWYFVNSLAHVGESHLQSPSASTSCDPINGGENFNNRLLRQEEKPHCQHPVLDLQMAGEEVTQHITDSFHGFLLSVSSMLRKLPQNSIAQLLAIRCWSVHVLPSDHHFLHSSQVFSNISEILSKLERKSGDDVQSGSDEMKPFETSDAAVSCVSIKAEITEFLDIQSSSHSAALGSLTDGSTETFWESADKDKTKVLTISAEKTEVKDLFLDSIHLHIDNTRDIGKKVSALTFFLETSDEITEVLQSSEVDSYFAGWICCKIELASKDVKTLKVQLKGCNEKVRARQLQVLGRRSQSVADLLMQKPAEVILSQQCERELLKAFRLLTAEIFGDLLKGTNPSKDLTCLEPSSPAINDDITMSAGNVITMSPQDVCDENLREHMVGILFSGNKLTRLQKQIFSHIVQAIAVESLRMKQDRENILKEGHAPTPVADMYCFQLLSMVLALSGSDIGRHYVAKQKSLIYDLAFILHTGTPRIQRQVCTLLRRIIPEVPPSSFAEILSCRLPSSDVFESNTELNLSTSKSQTCSQLEGGVLDVFLSCIAKSLSVQVKDAQSSSSAVKRDAKRIITFRNTCASDSNSNEVGWWWKQKDVHEHSVVLTIIALFNDMFSGCLGSSWEKVSKAFVAEKLLSLTTLTEDERVPTKAMKSSITWEALAALCVLNQEHVSKLTSVRTGQNEQKLLCTNHDDDFTLAVVKCRECGDLCADCDHFLHLNKRTNFHERWVLKEERQAVQVGLHEGCGRIKLYWVMALVDSKTLKGILEFRTAPGHYLPKAQMAACRSCGDRMDSDGLSTNNFCDREECQILAEYACSNVHPCGHLCGGVQGESCCLPCLYPSCTTDLKQDLDDLCMICFTDTLSSAPAIQLACGHIFHFHCCKTQMEKRWCGPRVTFGFTLCPICKHKMQHETLNSFLEPIRQLAADLEKKALLRLEYEGLKDCQAITIPGGQFYQDPVGFALSKYSYYLCSVCNKAYFGGEVHCDEAVAVRDDRFDPNELVCGACSNVSRAQTCPKHGTDFLEYKCRFCCSVAVYFCFGTTHFCQACHDDFQRVTALPINELPSCPVGPRSVQLLGTDCPLYVDHPPTGEEFALGCGICRNSNTF